MLTSLCANLGPVCCAARRGPQRLRVVSAAAGDEQPPSLGLGAPAGSSLLSVSPATSSTAAWVRSAVALDAAQVTSPPEYVFRLPSRQPARWSLQSLRVFVARHPLLFFHTKFSKRRDRERCDYGLSCSYPRPDASVEETHGKQRALLRLLDLFEASDPTIDCTWRQLDILASIACYIPESSWRAVLPKDVCADDEPSLMALPIHVLRQRKVVRIGAALLGVRHDDAADLFAEWESPIDRSHEPSQRALVTVSFAESSGQSVRSALKAAFPTLTITDKAVRFLQEDVKWRRKRLRRLCKDATPWFIDYASFFGGLRIAQAAGVVGLSVNSNELLFAAVLAMHLLPLLPLDAAEEAFWMDAVGLIARLSQDSGDSTLAQELAFLTSNAGNNVVPKGYLTSLPLAEVGCLLANTLRECGGNTVEAAKKCMDGRTAKTLGKQARVHCRQLTAEDTASSLWRVPFEQRCVKVLEQDGTFFTCPHIF